MRLIKISICLAFSAASAALGVEAADVAAARRQLDTSRAALAAKAAEIERDCPPSAPSEHCDFERQALAARKADYDRGVESFNSLVRRYRAEGGATRADANATRANVAEAASANARKFLEAGTVPRQLVDPATQTPFDYVGQVDGAPLYRDAVGNTLRGFHDTDGGWKVSAASGTMPEALEYDASQIVDLRTGNAVAAEGYQVPQTVTASRDAVDGAYALADAVSELPAWKAASGVASRLLGPQPSTVDLGVEAARINGSSLGSDAAPYRLGDASLRYSPSTDYYSVANLPANLPPGVYEIPGSDGVRVVQRAGARPELRQNGQLLATYDPVTTRFRR
jgi:hypothetical protein